MILASAVVDTINEPPANGKGLGTFRVECWGQSPNDYTRIYTIMAKDENAAAKEGIDTFVDEITNMISEETFQ